MPNPTARQVLTKTCDILDFTDSTGLTSTKASSNSISQNQLLRTIGQKLNVDSVFFYQPPGAETSVPHILFSHLEGTNTRQLVHELAQLHKAAWNMSRAPLLFATTSDGLVRIYNAYSLPSEPKPNSHSYQSGLIEVLNIFNESEAERLRQKYHRREFESGRFWQNNRNRFSIEKRADRMLLQNLRVMHRNLSKMLNKTTENRRVASEITHYLIGRAIFIKYLEDRRDSQGRNVFAEGFFTQFAPGATCFTDVLLNKDGTYKLFEYLRIKFNGDLFPVSQDELRYVQAEYLEELHLFLTGNARLKDRQLRLWKFYSFDVIPIEFISNIYEQFFFITEQATSKQEPSEETSVDTGTHYTPHHLVEFLVDELFPWEGTRTDYKVLDPACGSGIFLVEVYRRLIAHWQQANPDTPIQFEDLKNLLIENIFGVDLDKGAVHVAAFSLYLTLCDFLEPRQIWEHVSFPYLQDQNLFRADFFSKGLFFSQQKYDLIIGNPPWKSELTEACEIYISDRKKTLPSREFAPDYQIALAFLWYAPEMCKSTGEICLLVPSKGLLFNRSGPHIKFRQDFFSTFHVKAVINLSAYRRILFANSTGPGAVVYYNPLAPRNDEPVLYCSPKPTHSVEDRWQLTIDPYDIAELRRDEAAQNSLLWKIAMWGSPRDFELVNRLQAPPYQTLEKICENQQPNWIHGEGIIIGKTINQTQDASHLLGKPFLDIGQDELKRFYMDEKTLPIFDKPKVQWPRTKKAQIFDGPHILVKQSPKVGEPGFRAALLRGDTVFRDSLIGIHGSSEQLDLLAQCCLVLNSRIPLYYALMTSRRWLVERDELNKEEVMNFPMPPRLFEKHVTYQDIQKLAQDHEWEKELQKKIGVLYSLTDEDLFLIDDAINYTLGYFQHGNSVDTTYSDATKERHLEDYLEVALRTLANSFRSPFHGIIYSGHAPVRVLGVKAESTGNSNVIHTETSSEALESVLSTVNQYLREQKSPSVFVQRHVRAYVSDMIYVIKPDQRRYWTRSLALRDADEIYADIMIARESVT